VTAALSVIEGAAASDEEALMGEVAAGTEVSVMA